MLVPTARIASFLLGGCVIASAADAQVRISMVGKNNTTNVNNFDGQFVELFNAGADAVSLTGMSLQWASSPTGSVAASGKFDLDGVIQPGGYWLVRLSTHWPFNWGVAFDADQTYPLGFNGSPNGSVVISNAGKVMLVDTTALRTTGCTASDAPTVIDLVSWNQTASATGCFEGSGIAVIPAASGVSATAVLRRCGGLTDTNDNAADFIETRRPPRNSMWTGTVDAPAVDGVTQVDGQSGRGTTTGYAGQGVLFTTTPTTCTGSVASAVIDLTPISGPMVAAMRDDGLEGDAVAGDGVYSFRYTLPSEVGAPVGTYSLAISVEDSAGRVGLGAAPLTVAPAPPSNDLCGNPEVIPATGLPMFASAHGNLVSAGPIARINTACTTNSGSAGTSRDVWYSFTPVETGTYTITTCNEVTAPTQLTSMSTNLTIFDTCPPDSTEDVSVVTLGCSTNSCLVAAGGGPSTIDGFPMTAGTEYLIRVAKAGSGDSVVGGLFRLDIISEPFGACCFGNGTCVTLTQAACESNGGVFQSVGTTCTTWTCPAAPPPENNECDAAVVLTSGVAAPGTTFGASGTDITACDNTSWDVWYSYTPAVSGMVRVTTTRLTGLRNTGIAVFDSCPPATDAHLACVPVPLEGNQNTLVFAATAGTQYFIRTATHFSQRTDFTVIVEELVACCDGGGGCSLVTAAECTGTSHGPGSLCDPSPCSGTTGACCFGSTCAITTAEGCAGAGMQFAGAGTSCNVFGVNNTTPCCFADFDQDGTVAVPDIFAFLTAWFGGAATADIDQSGGNTVPDIFAFLTAWFAGCS
ncbi:MAG: lamin tail domain-containing protein [Phycisphaeraceae bacterium]|nr:lamin tail domain-containing protein [Phycisphaeraceae bacterium]